LGQRIVNVVVINVFSGAAKPKWYIKRWLTRIHSPINRHLHEPNQVKNKLFLA